MVSKPTANGLRAACCCLPCWDCVLAQGSRTLPLPHFLCSCLKAQIAASSVPAHAGLSPKPSHSGTAPGARCSSLIPSARPGPDGRPLGTEGLVTHASAGLGGAGLVGCAAAGRARSSALRRLHACPGRRMGFSSGLQRRSLQRAPARHLATTLPACPEVQQRVSLK